MAETIVVAVGGNSLVLDPRHVTVEDQYMAVEKTAESLVELIRGGHNIVIYSKDLGLSFTSSPNSL